MSPAELGRLESEVRDLVEHATACVRGREYTYEAREMMRAIGAIEYLIARERSRCEREIDERAEAQYLALRGEP